MASDGLSATASFGLAGKVAVLTGAAAGLGRATAIALVHEGATVCAYDRDAEGLERLVSAVDTGTDGRIVPYKLDVTSQPEVAEAVGSTIAKHERVDILINNAGIYPIVSFLEISDEQFDQVLSVNFKSAYFLARAIIPHMVRRSSGRIVNIATTSFHRPMPGHVHYTTSKAALVGLTRGLAAEFGRSGIGVNCVAPGVVATDTVSATFTEDLHETFVNARAIPRYGKVDDVVGAILFLCSDASGFITGQTVVVDGGRIMS